MALIWRILMIVRGTHVCWDWWCHPGADRATACSLRTGHTAWWWTASGDPWTGLLSCTMTWVKASPRENPSEDQHRLQIKVDLCGALYAFEFYGCFHFPSHWHNLLVKLFYLFCISKIIFIAVLMLMCVCFITFNLCFPVGRTFITHFTCTLYGCHELLHLPG